MAKAATTAQSSTNIPQEYVSNPFELLSPSFNSMRRNGETLVKQILLALAPVLPIAIGAILLAVGHGNLNGLTAVGVGLIVASGIVAFVIALLVVPMFTATMLAGAQGKALSFKESYEVGRPFVGRMFVLGILTILAVLGGLLLFVVPGIIFMAWFSLGALVLIAEDLEPMAAMKRSKALISGRVFEALGLMSAPRIAEFVPLIGSILSLALSIGMLGAPAIRYFQLSAATDRSKLPKTHWINYVVFFAPVLVGLFFLAIVALGVVAGIHSN